MESPQVIDGTAKANGVLTVFLGVIVLGNAVSIGIDARAFKRGQSQPSPQATFRAGIDVVQIDVSALNRDRVPVAGLQSHEFVVFENGRSRPIVGFEEIRIPSLTTAAGEAAWVREATRDTSTNALPEGRLLVLLLDDATVPPDPWTLKTSKRIGHEVVDRLGPDDLVAVVFTRDNRHAVNFTADRAKLRKAIESFSPGFNFLGRGDQYYDWSSAKTLREAVRYLSTQTQRRKAVIYVSVGVMYERPHLASVGLGGVLAEASASSAIDDTFRQMLTSAVQANVTVYPIDPAGLAGLEFYLLGRSQGRSPEAARAGAAARHGFLRSVARETGGRAVLDTNDVLPGVEQVFIETGQYYLLAYQAAEPLNDGRYRRIRVEVTRPGVTIISREGFFAPKTSSFSERGRDTSAAAEDAALTRVMAGLLPRSELPMRVSVAALGPSGSERGLVVVALDLDTGSAASLEPGHKVEIEGRAFTVEGDPVHVRIDGKRTRYWRHGITSVGSAERSAPSLLTSFEVPPGRYEIRLSASQGPAAGSVYADVDVPDFRREPLTLSGVFVSVGNASGRNQAGLSAGVSVTPTARRAFAAAEDVNALIRLYQGGRAPLASVGLHTRIVDTRGSTVLSHTETLDLGVFDATSRSTERNFKVPVAKLPPGAYLLSFEASSGNRMARRDVRFTVR